VFECQAGPTAFYKSRLAFVNNNWEYALKDGTVYVIGHAAALQAIRDRYGNETRLTWSATNTFGAGYGNLLRITSPNGRWIEFTYDAATPVNHITQAKDNIGRTVTYTYTAGGNLATVTDPENNLTTYTWDASNRLVSIKDGRNIVYLTNQYDATNRVTQQTLADPAATYTFGYTTDPNGSITQTDVTDPLAHVERFAFNSDHYVTSRTEAYGTALARTTTTTRQTASNLVTAAVDGLSRRTEYTYDSSGHALTQTRLAGTVDAVTTTFTYEPVFFQLATVTDPLNHTWTVGYDGSGKITSMTDPLGHPTSVTLNPAGQVTQVSDPLQHAWQVGYAAADLTSVTDPLGNVQRQFVDAAGRVISTTDALGRIAKTGVDKLNRPTSVTNPLGGQTTFSYDAKSNLVSLVDALTHSTSYTYDSADRVQTRTDPLLHAASYQYDRKDHLTQLTDRKGQVTGYTYDALDRLAQVTYGDLSTITYTYDAGDRITQIGDSVNGTITRQYDALNRLTQETTPQGTVGYTYDADSRRATMTVAGQALVSYGYDDANRLTAITQGTAMVSSTYDDANRRSTLTFPNGIVGTYGYDVANRLTSLTYTFGQTAVGSLTYTYDAAGNRTSVGGTWARTGLPAALASATYDAANRIATRSGTAFSYDPNGNLASDGLTSYAWNARNQLSGLSGGVSASFAYDAFGRRRGKTIAGATTNFLYDGMNFVQELTSGGTPIANLLIGLGVDETFARTDATGTSMLLNDALDTVIELADASGALQTHYTFDPFGATATSGAASTNAQAFTGRENDGTGLYFYRARFYSPALQRFLSEDPVGFGGGSTNLFGYVDNRPTVFTDPLGLQITPPPFPVPGAPPGTGWKWNADPGNPRGGTWGPDKPIPGQSQPSANEDPAGHWDSDSGRGQRQRYDKNGNPMTPDEAHRQQPPKPNPNQPPHSPVPPGLPGGLWRLPFPFPIIINPCLLNPFMPGCNPMLPGRTCGPA
jgi:RHS repeat-associated protein